jgi:multidrug efflux pump
VVLVFAVIILCLIPVLLKFTQNELAPNEDQGVIFMMSSSPQPANLDYLNAYTDQFTPLFKASPSTTRRSRSTVSTACRPASAAFCSSRGTSASTESCCWCRPNLANRRPADLRLQPAVAARHRRGLPFQFVINTAGDYPALLEVAQRIKARGGRQVRLPRYRPGLRQARGGGRHRPRQGGADGRVDGHLGGTLATLLGEAEINRFTLEGRSYKVIAQVERPYRDNPG